jgi:hypothetical protein
MIAVCISQKREEYEIKFRKLKPEFRGEVCDALKNNK